MINIFNNLNTTMGGDEFTVRKGDRSKIHYLIKYSIIKDCWYYLSCCFLFTKKEVIFIF